MKIIESFLTKSPYWKKNQNPTDSRYIAYQKNGPKGAMLHSVGCAQPSAEVFIDSWNDPGYTAACVHGFIDANTGDFYHTMPYGYRAPHAGGNANNTHIGIEMCEPDCIEYKKNSASFTVSNRVKARLMAERTYNSAVQVFALAALEYGWNPREPGVIISHAEGHDMGIASNHGDPEHLWKGLGMDYTMDGFRRDVKRRMEELTTVAGFSDVPTGVYYEEGLIWAKEKGIIFGKDVDTFGPDLDCTRAEIVTMLWRYWSKAKLHIAIPFVDVPADSYYHDAVVWAYNNGVVVGIDNDEFGPTLPCKRAEVVTMIHRLMTTPEPRMAYSPFDDVKPSAYYNDAVTWAYEQGIVKGVAANQFAPDAPVKRCEAVELLYRWNKLI